MAETSKAETKERKRLKFKETNAIQKTDVTHLKYIDMVKDAIVSLKQPRGALPRHILNYICANYNLENRIAANQSMNVALKIGVKNGLFKTVGRNADKYALDERKTNTKKSFKKKHSKASSSITEEESLESTIYIPNIKNAKLETTYNTKGKTNTKRSFIKKHTKASSSTTEEESLESKIDIPNMENAKLKMTSSTNTPESWASSSIRQEPCGSSAVSFCQSSPESPHPSLETMKVQHKDRLNVRALGDRQECYITAMDITHDGRILLADSGNISIKLFNSDGQHLSSLVLSKMFSDISAMSNEEAVISFLTETPLLCLDIKGRIKLEKDIEGTSKAMYISCCQNRIAATYWEEPYSVKLIDINGHIYWSRSLTDEGHTLFKMPLFTTLYEDNGVFKVTIYDGMDLKLVILNGTNGNILELIKLDLRGEAGVINGPGGSPYICYYQMGETEIYAWEPSHGSRQILMSESHGLGSYPRLIKYCEPTNLTIVENYVLSERKHYIDTFSIISKLSRSNE